MEPGFVGQIMTEAIELARSLDDFACEAWTDHYACGETWWREPCGDHVVKWGRDTSHEAVKVAV